MKDDLVQVYEGLTLLDAQELADRLDDAGIEAFTDVTDSPASGLVAGSASKIVLVRKPNAEQARQVVRRFESEGRTGVPRDEHPREETGLELPTRPRPSDDSPGLDIEGGGNERLDADAEGAEASEVEGLRLEDPGHEREDVSPDRIRGFGADRDLAQPADVDADEVTEQPIDRLDVSSILDEEETATPSANLRPGKARARGKKN